jgi:hypothetical protein
MASTDAKVQQASEAVQRAVGPLIEDYDKAVGQVIAGQASVSATLVAVFVAIEKVQQSAPPGGLREDGSFIQEDPLEQYAQRVVDLRRRMDVVAMTMKRAHVRLDSLQTAVGRHEQLASQKRKDAAAR